MTNPRKFSFLCMLFVALVLTVALASSTQGTARAQATELFISEYIEGSSFNKAIEIYNGTGSGIDLAADGYTLELYSNGAASPSQTVALSGVVTDGDVFVLAHGSADPAILAQTDLISSAVINFNGDDTVVLRKGGAVIDAFGQIGVDPGVEWPGGGVDDTLRRKADVCAGDTDATDPFDASIEWDSFPVNTFDGLGSHTANCGDAGGSPDLVINEIDYDQPGVDTAEFIEIKNNGADEVSLDGVAIEMVNGSSGGASVYRTVALDGATLAAGDYFVVCGNQGNVPNCDLVLDVAQDIIQNGAPDAVALTFQGSIIDTVSYEGDTGAPYTEGSGVGLIDDPGNADEGISRCPDGADSDQNHVDFVAAAITPGAANACTVVAPDVAISEFRIDQTGVDDDEYFELVGTPGGALDGLTYLVIGDDSGGSSGVIEEVTNLSGQTIPASGFFVAAESTFTLGTADFTTNLNFENSDNVTHLLVRGFSGSDGDDLDVDDDGVLDIVPWAEQVDCVALVSANPSNQIYCDTVVGPDGTFLPGHVYLCEDGWRIGSFALGEDTPGAENACDTGGGEIGMCGDPATFIHEVQGSGLVSPLNGQTVVVEGVVVGDFQNNDQPDNGDLNGFHLQEEDEDADDDEATSEGIFVFGSTIDVQLGDTVRVLGSVSEFNGMTEITVAEALLCGSGTSVTPATVTLPVDNIDDLEAYEGMSVIFPQDLYISEYFNFDRFGEIVLTTERQFQPTAVFEPGSPEAAALADLNSRSRLMLDDGRTAQNPDPAIHPNGDEFDLDNLFRGGDIVRNVTGVLDFSFGLYRVQPTAGAEYVPNNPRPAEPADVGGDIQVASFNVLNYFTTLTNAGPVCGPPGHEQECRGADTPEELERQRAKIVAAIAEMDADVVGLIEIQNDEGGSTEDLVNGLNDALGAGTYAYIDTGFVGTDAIKQAFIYQPASVTPVGDFAVLDTPEFEDPNNTGSPKNRPALAQTFMDNESGGVVTVVVNHLKSKGSGCGPGDDDPEQGNCNLTRTLAAQILADWLATDPTDSGDPDFLIIGDLNAYDKEDPIDALIANGYTDLVAQFGGEFAYSYVFDGQLGYLDHALANAALAPQVTGATVWHINADEADLIDYDMSFKQDAQDQIYAPDPYRSSDHDPVIVGLDLGVANAAPVCDGATALRDTLWPPNHNFVSIRIIGVTDPDGDPVTITIESIFQDEAVNAPGSGNTAPDGQGVGTSIAQVRAERVGGGNGRVYHISFTASDGMGGSCSGVVKVGVPGAINMTPVDDGPLYDSTVGPPSGRR